MQSTEQLEKWFLPSSPYSSDKLVFVSQNFDQLHVVGYFTAASFGGTAGTFAAASRFGTLPALILATSRRLFTSMMETSSLSVLLTHIYLPSGETTTQLGPPPVATWPTIFLVFTS